jgi:hypothetical protein
MVKSELDFVWITTDGCKFLYKEDAVLHQQHIDGDKNAE